MEKWDEINRDEPIPDEEAVILGGEMYSLAELEHVHRTASPQLEL